MRQFSSIFRSRLPHPKLDPLERGVADAVNNRVCSLPPDRDDEIEGGLVTDGVKAESIAEIFCAETFYERERETAEWSCC